MKVKKSLAIILTLLAVGQVSTAKAYENTNYVSQVNTKGDIIEITDGENDIIPKESTYLNEIFGGTNYSKKFNAYRKEGDTLNVNVQNNGKASVKFSLYKGRTKIQTVTVSPGGKTITVKNSSGVSGEYEVRVSNDDGAKMNLYIRARQFHNQ